VLRTFTIRQVGTLVFEQVRMLCPVAPPRVSVMSAPDGNVVQRAQTSSLGVWSLSR
jgi:hypothetical protein